MARECFVMLKGFVLTEPKIIQRADGSAYATCHICVGRGTRDVGDNRNYMKCDDPVILTNEKKLINEISGWHVNDIVDVKGVITVRNILKGSLCIYCGEKNTQEGTLVFVNPIDCKKRDSCASQEDALAFLADNREFSNIILAFGTLCTEPKKVKTKEGLIITRYQIAMNRKFRVRSDPPEIKADYPWVYSYGENAADAKKRLQKGAEIYIDGCLQARTIPRYAVCSNCEQKYKWTDRAMEIVPYQVEYISGYLTDEMLAAKQKENISKIKKSIFGYNPEEEDIDEFE